MKQNQFMPYEAPLIKEVVICITAGRLCNVSGGEYTGTQQSYDLDSD